MLEGFCLLHCSFALLFTLLIMAVASGPPDLVRQLCIAHCKLIDTLRCNSGSCNSAVMPTAGGCNYGSSQKLPVPPGNWSLPYPGTRDTFLAKFAEVEKTVAECFTCITALDREIEMKVMQETASQLR